LTECDIKWLYAYSYYNPARPLCQLHNILGYYIGDFAVFGLLINTWMQ